MGNSRSDSVKPGSLIFRSGSCKCRAAELFGVETIRSLLRGVLSCFTWSACLPTSHLGLLTNGQGPGDGLRLERIIESTLVIQTHLLSRPSLISLTTSKNVNSRVSRLRSRASAIHFHKHCHLIYQTCPWVCRSFSPGTSMNTLK